MTPYRDPVVPRTAVTRTPARTRRMVRLEKQVTLAVPHCREHDDGAVLTTGGPTGLVLLLRSWPYQRAFCELNDLDSLESPAIGRG